MTTAASTYASRATRIHQVFGDESILRLKRHLWQSGGTALAGLVASGVVLLYMALGPELEPRSAVFVSFLLLCAICLLVGGIVTFVSPVLDWLTYGKLQELRQTSAELDDLEMRHLVGVTLRNVYQVGNDDVRKLIEAKREPIELVCGEEITVC